MVLCFVLSNKLTLICVSFRPAPRPLPIATRCICCCCIILIVALLCVAGPYIIVIKDLVEILPMWLIVIIGIAIGVLILWCCCMLCFPDSYRLVKGILCCCCKKGDDDEEEKKGLLKN